MALVGVCLVGVSACSRSAASVKRSVRDLDGVTAVDVTSRESGLEGLGGPPVHSVAITMAPDATAEEVMAVFDELDDAIDAGDVEGVDVTLAGKDIVLSTGEDSHPTQAVVDDFVAAGADPKVTSYRREDYPVGDSVDVTVQPSSFAGVVAVADRYRTENPEDVSVTSDGWVLIRDRVNEKQNITDARQALVEDVIARYDLRGATVAGRGPLELYATKADEQAITAYADRHADPAVGSVVVRTTPPRP